MIPVNDLKRRIAPLAPALEAAVARVVAGGRYILGEACARFEAEFAAYCGVDHGIGVGNGTDALELSLRALGIGPGARVAATANAGMYASVAILAAGASPVYVDIDPSTLTMDPAALSAAGPVDAVIVTHLYGRMASMPAILAASGGAPVIEDCAQSHGAVLDGRKAGSWGALGAFSFYPTKNLGALGDGGAVVTGDAGLAERVRRLRQYGWSARYQAELTGGRNSRLDEIQAAALSVMLPQLDGWNARRRAIVAGYRASLNSDAIVFPADPLSPAYVGHLCVVRSRRRDAIRAALDARGVQTDLHYPLPDYRQPAVLAAIGTQPALPETERATAEVFTLPCFPELSDSECKAIAAALQAAVTDENGSAAPRSVGRA
ncbi:DegT/DnrJ/EryC1/StrS family aminotransferase [Dongia sp.]|uniref:DegT/DnrJ/EryC1/StrS family aminotransferase n=1 Tax=Dongia sp. TaxID=1977262 RepID=UPI003753E738